MTKKQLNPWPGLIFSLALAGLLGSLAYLTFAAIPVVANGFPNCGNAGSPPTPSPGAVFTLTGLVMNQQGTPVECVQVFAFSGPIQFYTYTNSSGQFTLTLNAGIYYDVVFNPPVGTELASQSRRGVHETQLFNITLPPGRAISGTIYSDTAKLHPVGNVAIFAFNQGTFVGFGLPPSQANGAYQISLEAGSWDITFTPPPFKSLGPTQITLILAGDVSRDIILQPGFTVYGTVMAAGQGQPGVEIFAQDPSQPNGYGFTPTDQTGVYTGTLPSGTFDILFLAPPFLGLGSTVLTNVTGPSDVQRNLTLPPGHTVSGTIKCGGTGLANAFVFAAPQPPVSAGHFGGWGRFAGADGFYALALQPGVYTITVSPPGGSSLPQRIIPSVKVEQDVTLNVDYYCAYLPTILKDYMSK